MQLDAFVALRGTAERMWVGQAAFAMGGHISRR